MSIKLHHKPSCPGDGSACSCPWRLSYRPRGVRGPHKRINFPTREEAEAHLHATTVPRHESAKQSYFGLSVRNEAEIERKIEGLIGTSVAYVFNGGDLLRMRKPCVYIYMRDAVVLYVGKGSLGIQRPLDCHHRRLRDVKPGDLLLIYQCPEGTESAIEQALITALKPRFNGIEYRSDYAEPDRAGRRSDLLTP